MLSISAARRVTAGARATRGGRVGGVGVSVGRGAGAPALLLRSQHHQLMMNNLTIPSSFYSTERILSLRNKEKKEVLPKTLYTPQHETENCGVGLVASLKSVASRKVVEDADEMLIRMSHRGGVGCCPASGDGAGEYRLESSCLDCDRFTCSLFQRLISLFVMYLRRLHHASPYNIGLARNAIRHARCLHASQGQGGTRQNPSSPGRICRGKYLLPSRKSRGIERLQGYSGEIDETTWFRGIGMAPSARG